MVRIARVSLENSGYYYDLEPSSYREDRESDKILADVARENRKRQKKKRGKASKPTAPSQPAPTAIRMDVGTTLL